MGIRAFPEALVYQVPTVATERKEKKESVEQKEGRVRLVPRPLQIGSNVFGRKMMTETTDCYRWENVHLVADFRLLFFYNIYFASTTLLPFSFRDL